jgi:hypothetical protein
MANEPEKHTIAQRKYHAKKRKEGMVRIGVWVPEKERDAFWQIVDKLRDQWHRRGLL